MNVKTRSKGKRKRDLTMDPVRSSADWKLQFLREFAEFLERWQQSGQPGLTRETFLAMRQTCLSLAECASYLLDMLGFSYVLFGHLQSDPIEARFGWLRQLSGANYLISMKQVLDSDKKIRAVSLLKFSGLSLQEIDEAVTSITKATAEDQVADRIAESLTDDYWPSSNDSTIIYYVSGAVARSIVRCNKCDHCREALVTDDELPPIEFDQSMSYNVTTFFDNINRGGLTRPSEYTFMTAVQCWRVFSMIKSSASLTSQFLSATEHRSLFSGIVDRAVSNDEIPLVEDNYCFNGHDIKAMIVSRLFNCLAKNLVHELSNSATQQAEEMSRKRKIAKLSSATAQ